MTMKHVMFTFKKYCRMGFESLWLKDADEKRQNITQRLRNAY